MYRYIFIDLDDTLLDFTTSQYKAIQRLFKEVGLTFTEDLFQTYAQYNRGLWQQIEQGTLTKQELLRSRFANFLAPYGIEVDGLATDEKFRAYLADGADLVTGAYQLLLDLKANHRKVYAASNGVYHTQINRLKAAGILDLFDALFISEKIGAEKPAPAFFKAIQSQLGDQVAWDQAIMIGDSLSSDIPAANHIDLTTCWFNPKGLKAPDQLSIDYQIKSLQELYPIIGISSLS